MRALKVQSPGHAAVVSNVPTPTLLDDYLLVKTVAVALNPSDWKHLDRVDTPTTIGCDYAGIVEEVGPKVTKSWKKGDRVCGVTHGGNQDNVETGADGEYLIAKGDIQIKIPEDMSFEEAAALGVGVMSVGE